MTHRIFRSRRRGWISAAALVLGIGLSSCSGRGREESQDATVRVAVAGNFAAPHAELAAAFRSATGIDVATSLGATGQLFAQIVNGAPFDIFLAADTTRPRLLEEKDLTVPGTRFTYAIGRLALYAPGWDSVGAGHEELRSRPISNLAIANPQTAPYGAAAIAVLQLWGLEDDFEDRIVRGENVGQAFQFVASGAAEAGFVALSQVVDGDPRHYRVIADSLHPAIRQDAVLLRLGQSHPHAQQYLEFIRGEAGRRLIASFGYSLPVATR